MTTFLDLTDTPNVYTDSAGKVVVVNDSETGVEFKTTQELGVDLGSIERPDCTDLADDDVKAIEPPELRDKIYRVTEAIKRCLEVHDLVLFGADLLGGVVGPAGADGAPGSTGPAGLPGSLVINQNGSSPAFSFTRANLIKAGTWLYVGENPSNITGKRNNLYNSAVEGVHIAVSQPDTFSIGVYYHDGNLLNLTLLDTFSVVAANGADFVDLGLVVPKSKQMAMKVESGTITNGIDAGIVMSGTLTP
jgi:hypothetical protein